MNQFLNKSVSICVSLILSCTAFTVHALETVTIKKETSEYILDIKYPQQLPSSEENAAIKELIKKTRSSFMSELIEDASVAADAPGKTSLNISYSIPYQTKTALSVRFDVSIYHRGSAHPYSIAKIINFVNGHQVKLSDLFIEKTDYLKSIAVFCNKVITARNISDAPLIKEGTTAKDENYQNWFFTPKGIAVVFNAYQVAAYVYGEQTVMIPLAHLSTLIKPKLSKIIWNHE